MTMFDWLRRNKIHVPFILTVLLMLVIGVFAAFVIGGLGRIKGNVMDYKNYQEEITIARGLQLNVANVWQFITDASLTKERDVLEKEARPNLDGAVAAIDRLIARKGNDPARLGKLRELKTNLATLWETGNRMFEAYLVDWNRGNMVMEEYDKICDVTIQSVEGLVKESEARGDGIIHDLIALMADAMQRTMIFAALLIAICLLVSMFIRLVNISIVRPLNTMIGKVNLLASGDLTVDIDYESRDEIGVLAGDMRKMVSSYSEIISRIAASTNSILNIVEAVRNRTGMNLEGARKQSGRAMQIATAAEEMSLTIIDISRNTTMASETSAEMLAIAVRGREMAVDAVSSVNHVHTGTEDLAAMVRQLNDRVTEISDITKVIGEIADQTNLLALNAAIEAARAGEQGRGFAVVADEVRKLADKTLKATGEITGMIKAVQSESARTAKSMGETTEEVAKVTRDIGQLGDFLNSIGEAVQNSRDQIAQIATAVEQQSATAQEVAANIEETSNIAKDVEQMSDMVMHDVSKLIGIAEELRDATLDFKTNGTEQKKVNLAITDHRLFVNKIVAGIHGGVPLDPGRLLDHQTCRNARRFDGKGEKECAFTAGFNAPDSPHARVHELSREAMSAYNRGDREQAVKLLNEMEKVSDRIMVSLDGINREQRDYRTMGE